MDTTKLRERSAGAAEEATASRRVEGLVRERLAEDSPRACYWDEVTCEFADGLVTFHGRVPTDQLKTALGGLVRDLREVVLIDNQVDVISRTGLSSVRPR